MVFTVFVNSTISQQKENALDEDSEQKQT